VLRAARRTTAGPGRNPPPQIHPGIYSRTQSALVQFSLLLRPRTPPTPPHSLSPSFFSPCFYNPPPPSFPSFRPPATCRDIPNPAPSSGQALVKYARSAPAQKSTFQILVKYWSNARRVRVETGRNFPIESIARAGADPGVLDQYLTSCFHTRLPAHLNPSSREASGPGVDTPLPATGRLGVKTADAP
jgi:hypothetical protein